MNEFHADLHCHSTCSDGTASPQELLILAKQTGLSALSITDHDTIDSYPEAIEMGRELGIEVIPGVEFSTVYDNQSVHVLAYRFDLDNPDFLELCKWHKTRRERRYLKMLEKLAQHNMPLEPESRELYGRPHIAQSMIEKGYVSSVQEAFGKWIGEGKPCFHRDEWKGVEETIDVIHKAGGVAIIAHPHLIDRESTLKALLKMPFDGLEGYYANFKANRNSRYLKLARERNWLITGGSDFHGTVKPANKLGSSWISRELFEALLNR